MDAVLADRWLGERERVGIFDQASLSIARDTLRALATELAIPNDVTAAMAIVVSELATNQLRHATRGQIAVCPVERDGVAGIEIVAVDGGEGIGDPGATLDGGTSSELGGLASNAPSEGSFHGDVGLGIGLSGVQRLSDEVDFDVRLGIGTCVRARKFATRVRRRREVAILGRSCTGERTSGDDASFERTSDDVLLLVLADGLGHGPDARLPAANAIGIARAHAADAPSSIVRAADVGLKASRGAVMGVLRIDEKAGRLAHAAVGNIVTRVCSSAWSGGKTTSFSGARYVLGAAGGARAKVFEEEADLDSRAVVVMCSDGLRTRIDLEEMRPWFGRHPLVLAHELLRKYGRDNDDATIIVAR